MSIDRRSFLKTAGAVVAGAIIAPARASATRVAYNDNVRLAIIGNGGMGKAYLTLYGTTDNAEFRDIAFQGIKKFPTQEAYQVILEDLDMAELDGVSTETLTALNVMLDPDEFPDEVAALRSDMLGAAQVRTILDMAHHQGESGAFVQMMGFVTRWHLIGPFTWASGEGFGKNPIEASTVDLKASYLQRNWKQHTTGDMVILIGLIGQYNGASAYGYATI